MAEWAEYEKVIEKIYRELEPSAKIVRNDKIVGLFSKIERQIDVSIRTTIATHEMLVIVQAKDYKEPADVNDVEEFASVVEDVKANKGIFICNAGFTGTAKTYATNKGIDLYSIHDAQSQRWLLNIKFPLLWIDYLPELQILCQMHLEEGDLIPTNPRQWVLSSDDGKTRISVLETFERRWNALELDRSCGKTHILEPEQRNIKILVVDKSGNNVWRPIDSLRMSYTVSQKAWLGFIPPSECRGILDQIKDEFAPTYFKISEIPMKRDESWETIDDPNKVAITTKGVLITTEHWKISVDNATFGSSFNRIG